MPTILTLGIAGFVLYPLIFLWVAVRSLKAMVTAQKQEPIFNVETWLW